MKAQLDQALERYLGLERLRSIEMKAKKLVEACRPALRLDLNNLHLPNKSKFSKKRPVLKIKSKIDNATFNSINDR